jgi:hypothetical protein
MDYRTHPRAARPPRYRRAGLWQTALRRLHARGWTDPSIAEALNDLDDAAIATLERVGWTVKLMGPLLRDMAGVSPGEAEWTDRHVRYYRRQWGLPQVWFEAAGTDSPDLFSSLDAPKLKVSRKRLAQRGANHPLPPWEHAWKARHQGYACRGWSHLTARGDEIQASITEDDATIATTLGPGWTAAIVAAWRERPWEGLRQTEVDILCALWDGGSMTRVELAEATGRTPGKKWQTNGQTWTTLLIEKGMVVQTGWKVYEGATRRLYALAPGMICYPNEPPQRRSKAERERRKAEAGSRFRLASVSLTDGDEYPC